MPIRLATNCAQIEMAVTDVPAACREFESLLGAKPIEQELVKRITGVVLDIDHRGCGDAMFQFCSPLIDDIPARYELDRIGPCVTNLNFFVEDAAEAQALLEAAGGETRLQWQTGHGAWERFLGEGNARKEFAAGYFMGTRNLFGFDFEMTEPFWIDPTKQEYFHPAFTYPRPPIDDKVEKLVRLRVVVDDLDRYLGNVVELIDRRDRTDVHHESAEPGCRTARIDLRGLELEYVQPLSEGPLQDQLRQLGPTITTAVFSVADIEQWPARFFDRREILGFDVELTEE